jgi:hypothetical protein
VAAVAIERPHDSITTVIGCHGFAKSFVMIGAGSTQGGCAV